MFVSACGGAAVEEAAEVESTPLAAVEEAPVEAPAEQAAETAPEVEFDLVAAVDSKLSALPDGFILVNSVDGLKTAMDSSEVVLIDVREVGEYEEGHLPGAVNIPLHTLAQNLDKVPTDKPVFVYCKSGYRAALSTAALQTLGFTNVRAFPPSMAGWQAAGEAIAALQ